MPSLSPAHARLCSLGDVARLGSERSEGGPQDREPAARPAGDVSLSAVQPCGAAALAPAFLASRAARNLSARTLERYAWALAKLPEAQTAEALESAIAAMTRLSAASRWDVWRSWHTYFRWRAVRHGLADPMQQLEPPRRRPRLPITLSWHDLTRVLAAALSRRDRAILMLLLDTGLRVGELAALTPADLHQDQAGAWSVQVDGKTGPRVVPVSAGAVRLLTGLLPWGLTRSGVQQAVRRCMRRAGVRRGGPHALRHSFALHYISRGGDVFSLQRILGHSSITTTRIYVDMAAADVHRQHAKYSPALALLDEAAS